MVAPIFRFRNVKLRLTTANPTFVYGVVAFDPAFADRTLADTVAPDSVSTVVLTVQASNITGYIGPTPAPPSPGQNILITAYVQNNAVVTSFDVQNSRVLVNNYPVIANNAFDPLSGNLVLSANDQLWLRSNLANACDVTISLLEIANATAS